MARPHVVTRVGRGISRAVRARPGAFAAVAVLVFLLDVFLPLLVLSLTRKPVDFFSVNPWLSMLPGYLLSGSAPLGQRIEKTWGLALFWCSAANPYGVEYDNPNR